AALDSGGLRGGLRPARDRAAASPAPGRFLDQEPGVPHRQGAARPGLCAGRRPGRRRGAHRGFLPARRLALSERAARLTLAVVAALITAAAVSVRLPQFWGDGATYHAMAWSLAEDFD